MIENSYKLKGNITIQDTKEGKHIYVNTNCRLGFGGVYMGDY